MWPKCSVVIPSHGRALYLQRVVDGLANQTMTDFEVILIDNNQHAQLGALNPGRLLERLQVVHEPRVGLSRAKNRGVAHARGEFVAFLDDDTVPEPSWLEMLLQGLSRHFAAVAGGAIELGIQGNTPGWLGMAHRQLLAELLWEGKDIPEIGRSRYICGGNMAASKRTFDVVGGFRESFGRVGGVLRSSEELEWCCRAQTAGFRITFVVSARVQHQVGPSRLTASYLLRRGFWQGRSDALLERRHGRPIEFGLRSNRRNVVELVKCGANLARARGGQARAAGLLALVRELGYCIQYAWLSAVS